MKIVFYGRLAEAIGPELELGAVADCSVADVRDRLAAEHPRAGAMLRSKRSRACIADRFVHDDYRVVSGDTLEFLPPVSGG